MKGVSEQWKTYTWQGIHRTEYECFQSDPDNFYLYIVRYSEKNSDNIVGFYVISGSELAIKFRMQVESYGLRPISQAKLAEYLIDYTRE